MDYIVATTAETDEIHLPSGEVINNMLGSAGIYAFAGIRLYTEDVVITGGIGPSFFKRHGTWFDENRISKESLYVRSDVTPTTIVTYFEDGSRIDEPNIGIWKFRELDPSIEDIKVYCDEWTKGIYVFKHLDTDYLDGLIELKRKCNCKILWEISSDACLPSNIETIEKYLKEIDVFSINSAEAYSLYDTDDDDFVRAKLLNATENWVFLRHGSKGAYLLADGEKHFCPSVTGLDVVDCTGAGNASSAAVLYAYCERYTPKLAVALGAAAAARIIEQYGVPAIFTERIRDVSIRQAKQLISEV